MIDYLPVVDNVWTQSEGVMNDKYNAYVKYDFSLFGNKCSCVAACRLLHGGFLLLRRGSTCGVRLDDDFAVGCKMI